MWLYVRLFVQEYIGIFMNYLWRYTGETVKYYGVQEYG